MDHGSQVNLSGASKNQYHKLDLTCKTIAYTQAIQLLLLISFVTSLIMKPFPHRNKLIVNQVQDSF